MSLVLKKNSGCEACILVLNLDHFRVMEEYLIQLGFPWRNSSTPRLTTNPATDVRLISVNYAGGEPDKLSYCREPYFQCGISTEKKRNSRYYMPGAINPLLVKKLL